MTRDDQDWTQRAYALARERCDATTPTCVRFLAVALLEKSMENQVNIPTSAIKQMTSIVPPYQSCCVEYTILSSNFSGLHTIAYE